MYVSLVTEGSIKQVISIDHTRLMLCSTSIRNLLSPYEIRFFSKFGVKLPHVFSNLSMAVLNFYKAPLVEFWYYNNNVWF